MNKIPVIVLTWNRLQVLKTFIEAFVERTAVDCYDLFIIDNNSEQLGMREYLLELEKKFTVIHNDKNYAHWGWQFGIREVRKKHGRDTNIIISDPDMLLQSGIPSDWPMILEGFLRCHTNVAKVGLAADISHLPKESSHRKSESQYWLSLFKTNFIPDPCYYANISTSMCMLHHDTYTEDLEVCVINNHICNFKKYETYSIRIAGRFSCIHPYFLRKNFPEDYAHLKNLYEGKPYGSGWYSGSFVWEYGLNNEEWIIWGGDCEVI